MKITVKQARVGVEMTQEEMAEKLGVSLSTYAQWEKAPEKRMTYENVVKFARITGVSLEDLKMGAN